MILLNPKSDTKASFNEMLTKRAGGLDKVTQAVIYRVAYELYCALAHANDKQETLKIMLEAVADELKEITLQRNEARDEVRELNLKSRSKDDDQERF